MAYLRLQVTKARWSIFQGLAARRYLRDMRARGLHLHGVGKSNMPSQQILEDRAVLVLIREPFSKL